MPTVTMTDMEYRELLRSISDAADREAALTRELQAAQRQDADGRIEVLIKALEEARTIVGFAVANYPPEVVINWPHEALVRFSEHLEAAPGMPYAMKEMAIDLRGFAREVAALEKERSLRKTTPTPTKKPVSKKPAKTTAATR